MQKAREIQGILLTQTKIPWASVEEVPEEEEQQKLLPKPQATVPTEEMPPERIEIADKLLIAYIRGEPVVRIFKLWETPFTEEYSEPRYSYSREMAKISWITTSKDSTQYSFSQSVWIWAKTLVSQHLAHRQEEESNEQKKMLNELLLKDYLEYQWV